MPSEDDVSIKILRSIACFALSHIFWDAFLEAYSSEEALMFLGKTGCKFISKLKALKIEEQ